MLCHDAEGSYLTFAGGGELQPLLDSGQGRFNDASKRFYFFLEQDPHAFDLALERLDVDDVLITRPMAAWVLAMANQPAWHLAAWSDEGLLFARGPVPTALNWSERDQLRQLHDNAQRVHDPVWAFCFSTLVDDPENSLALLDHSRVTAWSESFLNFFCAWLDRVPTRGTRLIRAGPSGARQPAPARAGADAGALRGAASAGRFLAGGAVGSRAGSAAARRPACARARNSPAPASGGFGALLSSARPFGAVR